MKKFIAIILIYVISLLGACCDKPTRFITQIIKINIEPKTNVINIDKDLEFKVIQKDSVLRIGQSLDFGLITSAYAYDCDNSDILDPIESINKIEAQTITDFSNNFKKNSIVNDLIRVNFFNWKTQKIETSSLEEFMKFIEKGNSNISKSAEIHNATFQVTGRPTLGQKQKWRFVFTFTDNTTVSTDTEEITWK